MSAPSKPANPFAMKARAKTEGSDYTPPPAGSHPAALVAVVDLGTHTDVYNGEAKTARQIYLVWELLGEQREDGQNHLIGQRYTLSSHSKASFRLMLEGWRGRGFADNEDFNFPEGWVGKNCLANVTHETSSGGKEYAKLKAIAPLPKMMEKSCPKPSYPVICWSFASDDELPDVSHLPYVFGVPVKDKVEASKEWKETYLTKPMGNGKQRPDPDRPLADDGETQPKEEEIPF